MKIIFIHPNRFDGIDSGSKLRPVKMYQTFCELGYDVTEITGSQSEIQEKVDKVQTRIAAGQRFDYVYFESLSIPSNLRIAKLFGQKFYKQDNTLFRFIDFCVSKAIPIGYYLRDIHWDFPETYSYESLPRRLYYRTVLRNYGKQELKFLNQEGITLFTPSLRFGEYIFEKWGVKSKVLYPGADILLSDPKSLSDSDIYIFYVGGVVGIYEIDVFINGLKNVENVQFTACVRPKEAYAVRKFESLDFFQIVHGSGNGLLPYYKKAHIAVYPLEPKGYVSMAFSIKISEYIGHGLPIVIFEGSEAASFVKKYNIGWVIPFDSQSVANLIDYIDSNRKEYKLKQQNVINIQSQFVWSKVVERLQNEILNNESFNFS